MKTFIVLLLAPTSVMKEWERTHEAELLRLASSTSEPQLDSLRDPLELGLSSVRRTLLCRWISQAVVDACSRAVFDLRGLVARLIVDVVQCAPVKEIAIWTHAEPRHLSS